MPLHIYNKKRKSRRKYRCCIVQTTSEDSTKIFFSNNPVDTGRKLNVYKTFRRRPGRLLNILCTFNLRPVSIGKLSNSLFLPEAVAQKYKLQKNETEWKIENPTYSFREINLVL